MEFHARVLHLCSSRSLNIVISGLAGTWPRCMSVLFALSTSSHTCRSPKMPTFTCLQISRVQHLLCIHYTRSPVLIHIHYHIFHLHINNYVLCEPCWILLIVTMHIIYNIYFQKHIDRYSIPVNSSIICIYIADLVRTCPWSPCSCDISFPLRASDIFRFLSAIHLHIPNMKWISFSIICNMHCAHTNVWPVLYSFRSIIESCMLQAQFWAMTICRIHYFIMHLSFDLPVRIASFLHANHIGYSTHINCIQPEHNSYIARTCPWPCCMPVVFAASTTYPAFTFQIVIHFSILNMTCMLLSYIDLG